MTAAHRPELRVALRAAIQEDHRAIPNQPGDSEAARPFELLIRRRPGEHDQREPQ